MKLTIKVEGVVNITERWEAGALAHEQRYAGLPAEPVSLTIEHSDVDALLGQSESFLLASISDGRELARMPSTAKAQREIGELDRKVADLEGAISGRDQALAGQRETIDTMSSWKQRAIGAGMIIDALEKFIAPMRSRDGGQAIPWPKGLRKRIEELRSDYPNPF